MLKNILESHINRNKLSIRSAAKEIGISHTTMNRLLTDSNFDLETIIKISAWVGMKPAELLGLETGDDVSLLVLAIPGLKEVLSESIEKVRNGEIQLSDLADITSYAKFRISQLQGSHENSTSN